mmetsp:Transcript_91781/g.278800  ORF Transcript_91781/g.278800 Transcript_91781/m.278800 type:complete len:222 (-) Transcript_91781:174-839(-)
MPGGSSKPGGSSRAGPAGLAAAASSRGESCSEPLAELCSELKAALNSGSDAMHVVGESLSAAVASCSEPADIVRAKVPLAGLFLVFFLALISPSGHRWQWPHSRSFWQPCGFQNQAQGLQRPVPWRADPWLGMPGWGCSPGLLGETASPGGGCRPEGASGPCGAAGGGPGTSCRGGQETWVASVSCGRSSGAPQGSSFASSTLGRCAAAVGSLAGGEASAA